MIPCNKCTNPQKCNKAKKCLKNKQKKGYN